MCAFRGRDVASGIGVEFPEWPVQLVIRDRGVSQWKSTRTPRNAGAVIAIPAGHSTSRSRQVGPEASINPHLTLLSSNWLV